METQAKASDELTSAEEKMENLNKIKTKLEVSYKSNSLTTFQNCLTTKTPGDFGRARGLA